MHKAFLMTIIGILCLVSVPTVLAQSPSLIPADPLSIHADCNFKSGEVKPDCVPAYVAYLIKTVFSFTGAVSMIVIMIGGFQYALGNIVGGKEKGEQRIRWGILGLLISALSFFIVDFIASTIAGL